MNSQNGQGNQVDTSKFPPRYLWGEIKEEEIIHITDINGTVHDLINSDGDYYPVESAKRGFIPDPRLSLPKILDMELNEDDIFICAYPKAGTHWVWEITKMLTKNRAEYEIAAKESVMLEFHMPEEFESMQSPRVFNTHLEFRQLPRQIFEKKCKIIYIQRNPKDVAVSQFCHRRNYNIKNTNNWEKFIRIFETESDYMTKWFTYTLDWEKHIHERKDLCLLPLYYENVKKNPIQEIKRLAKFLGVNCDDSLAEQIEHKCNFHNLKKANNEVKEDFNLPVDKKPKNNSSDLLYRKGEVGDWKNWFTVAQNERFDKIYKQMMKKSKLEFIYTLTTS